MGKFEKVYSSVFNLYSCTCDYAWERRFCGQGYFNV